MMSIIYKVASDIFQDMMNIICKVPLSHDRPFSCCQKGQGKFILNLSGSSWFRFCGNFFSIPDNIDFPQVVEYLGLDRSLQEEGIFRKNAALRKKEELLERLESGQRLDLHEEEFSVHEAASALKALLAGLDEPLLTDLCFPAVTCLGGKDRNYWLSGLRLLLQVNKKRLP